MWGDCCSKNWCYIVFKSIGLLFFILPTSIHKEIDSKSRDLLWVGTGLERNKAKVAWDDICVPKEEDRLGLIRCKDWNMMAIARHVWNLA